MAAFVTDMKQKAYSQFRCSLAFKTVLTLFVFGFFIIQGCSLPKETSSGSSMTHTTSDHSKAKSTQTFLVAAAEATMETALRKIGKYMPLNTEILILEDFTVFPDGRALPDGSPLPSFKVRRGAQIKFGKSPEPVARLEWQDEGWMLIGDVSLGTDPDVATAWESLFGSVSVPIPKYVCIYGSATQVTFSTLDLPSMPGDNRIFYFDRKSKRLETRQGL